MIATALGVDVSDLAALSKGQTPLTLNSMCTVFAESEVIGLLTQGKAKGEIIAGLHQSIARRITSMAQRMGSSNTVTFTGGVAINEGVRASLEEQLGSRCEFQRLSVGGSNRSSTDCPGFNLKQRKQEERPLASLIKRRRNDDG